MADWKDKMTERDWEEVRAAEEKWLRALSTSDIYKEAERLLEQALKFVRELDRREEREKLEELYARMGIPYEQIDELVGLPSVDG